MELCGILKHLEMKDYFMIAKISSQSFPEIQPSFVKNSGNEICKSWTIMNNQGVHHELIYNQIEMHPLVLSGWPCMESYYNLPSDVVLTIGYYGNNNFSILSFKEVRRAQDLPHFHSRNVFSNDIYYFDVDLHPFSVDIPKLVELSLIFVKLQENFATFLRDHAYEYIVLCGDNGKNKFMSTLKIEDPRRTKIGYGWNDFCKSNNFKCGDRIRFRLDVTSLDKTCYVYLIA
ncbi:uncharacterized protein LOC131658820 [Vicia villosa]|uniref:uncharacterized protein LOC131658820 n=1 Tax=Vicia villosa TaxID=3911 RepID=UPI00273B44EB|nr:uncharacterized protein LOC131658820 [Vicia villosa]